MPKQKKNAPVTLSALRGESGAGFRRMIVRSLVAGTLVGGVGYGFYRLREQVERRWTFPSAPVGIIIKDRPAWMSDVLAKHIADTIRPVGIHSTLDHQMLKDVTDLLAQNPWVRNVRQVRRVFNKAPGDAMEIDCEFRAPIAMVRSRDELILIDGDGVRLPERYSAATAGTLPRIMFDHEGRTNIRIIEGVHLLPPHHDGQVWQGDDLRAGLELVKFLHGKSFTDDIHRVSVANFGGRRSRREPQLTLITKHGSEVRWGEPVTATFHAEVSPGEKLERLAAFHNRYGRVDGGYSWVDIRLDKVLAPKGESPLVQR